MSAADFTNIRVESNSYDTTTIRYSYAGAGAVSLWRSTDNSSFSSIQNIPAAYGSYPTIVDSTVASATLYYYKLSDDAGSTFTSTYTVKSQVQFQPFEKYQEYITLPVFSGNADVDSATLDLMRSQLEAYINSDRSASIRRNCIVCPVNGALVLDCADGCFTFTVEAADISDINSISINCEVLEVVFNIPDSGGSNPIEICGWELASGYTGDECFQAPISTSVVLPVRMTDPSPCPVTNTLLTSSPCKGDYIYECYDKGSLFKSSTRNPAVGDCGCSSFFEGLISGDAPSPFTWYMRSGVQTGIQQRDHIGMAGMSIVYKSLNSSCVGAPGSPNILEYNIGGFGGQAFSWSITGKPIFGFAVNVPVGATMKSFTGRVFLFDYSNSRYVWGDYANADLTSGVMPSIITTSAMTFVPTKIGMVVDGSGIYSPFYDVVFENDSDLEFWSPATSSSVIAAPIGCGVIWVANHNTGNHAARIVVGDESYMLWWG